jgi:integrase
MKIKIHERKDGRFQFNYTVTLLNGKKKPKSIIKADKQEVKRLAIIAMYEADQYTDIGSMKLGEYIIEWFELHKKKLADTTIASYEIYIKNHIIKSLGEMRLSKVNMFTIQEFLNSKAEEGYKRTTIKHMKKILNLALKDAVRNGTLKSNPAEYTELPKSGNEYVYQVYDIDDYEKLLEASINTKFELPVVLSAMCGLRRGEVFGLRWQDVDLGNAILKVNNTAVVIGKKIIIKEPKTKTSIRTVTIPTEALKVLKRNRGFGYVVGNNDIPQSGMNFAREFRIFLEENNLKKIRFHDLRHFHATYLMTLGIDIKMISARLGHSNVGTTQNIYQHMTEKMDVVIAEKINIARSK